MNRFSSLIEDYSKSPDAGSASLLSKMNSKKREKTVAPGDEEQEMESMSPFTLALNGCDGEKNKVAPSPAEKPGSFLPSIASAR